MPTKSGQLLTKSKTFEQQLKCFILAELEKINASGASSGLASETTVAAILATQATEQKQDDALGGNGTDFIYVSTGAVTNKTYKYLVANEDCTFTTLAGSTTANLLAAVGTGLGISTNTVSKGMIIRGLNGETIKDITMLTGSVIGIR